MKLLVKTNTKELSKYLKFTDSFLIGLKDYSVNYYELTIDEIKNILTDYPNINLFISINKNIFNNDLKKLEENLISLSNLNIAGVLFYDISILSIVKRLNLNIKLVYHQTHMVTNYNICNFYYDMGCSYAYLSSEITVDEMLEIRNNTEINLIVYFIGHQIISHSKRKLVTNFYNHINKNNNKEINILKEKNKDDKYYITEQDVGTNILTYDILNGTEAFINLKDKIEYGILDNYLIDDSIFIEILKNYKNNLDNQLSDVDLVNNIKQLIGEYDGFFYKKSIYKVKE